MEQVLAHPWVTGEEVWPVRRGLFPPPAADQPAYRGLDHRGLDAPPVLRGGPDKYETPPVRLKLTRQNAVAWFLVDVES